jgi:hypothetical protein
METVEFTVYPRLKGAVVLMYVSSSNGMVGRDGLSTNGVALEPQLVLAKQRHFNSQHVAPAWYAFVFPRRQALASVVTVSCAVETKCQRYCFWMFF